MSKKTIANIVSVILLVLTLSPLFLASHLYSMASLDQRAIPQKEAAFSRQYFALVQAHDFEGAKKFLSPKIDSEHFKKVFDQMTALFPSEAPKSVKAVDWNGVTRDGVIEISLTSEYEFSDKWLVANIVMQQQGDSYLVEGVHINPLNTSLEDITRFRFLGQNMVHYLVFIAAIAVLLLDLYALRLCIEMPVLKFKWLWIIFILFGFGSVTYDWLSGMLYYNLLVAKVPVIQFSQMLFQPFLITITLPLGAIVFLFMRRKWAAAEA